MNAQRTSLEIMASSVEEAIQNGLHELGLKRDDVEVEVLDEGARGLFGLGARLARVRLTVKDRPSSAPASRPAARAAPSARAQTAADAPQETESLTAQAEPTGEEIELPPAEAVMDDLTLQVVRETVQDLLRLMNFKAEVSLRYGEADEMNPRPPILVDIQGEDLSMLIGKRAETLNAFQYIASLIVSKELGRYATIIVDVEGYRQRRSNQLQQLAKRMAEQAIKTGRRQILEPMPANERRVIHMTLRDYPNVRTESVGEEPYRKVTIIPT